MYSLGRGALVCGFMCISACMYKCIYVFQCAYICVHVYMGARSKLQMSFLTSTLHFFFKDYFCLCMSMYVCMCVCYMHAGAQRGRRRHWIPEIWSCRWLCITQQGCWEPNLIPLEEQPALLATEPFLQLPTGSYVAQASLKFAV